MPSPKLAFKDYTLALWNLENNGNDDSINGNHLSINGSPTYSQSIVKDGSYSHAMSYSTGDYFRTQSAFNTALSNKSDYIIDFWFYPNPKQQGYIILTINSTNGGWIRMMNGGLDMLFLGYPGSFPFPGGVGAGVFYDNEWNHILLAGTSSTLKLYINKTLCGQASVDANLGTVSYIEIGNSTANCFIDRFRVSLTNNIQGLA
jgi:hypothetical protein